MNRDNAASGSAAELATQLMLEFATRTGITGSAAPQRRYLWTDAFAVCNFLGLARTTGQQSHAELALRLVDGVHRTLGRYAPADARSGWLSGLPDDQAEQHPTRAGLRIGKRLLERAPGRELDETLEWERDGQYLHYLTKWMHALDQTARALQMPIFNRWARELAETAHQAFCASDNFGRRRVFWKMSVDLSRPLVSATGQHDVLDAFLTCAQLRQTARELGESRTAPNLERELCSWATLLEPRAWPTADPLGVGGLLTATAHATQLIGCDPGVDEQLLSGLVAAALKGLRAGAGRSELGLPVTRRLAFRELGLAIGLAAFAPGSLTRARSDALGASRLDQLVDPLRAHSQLGAELETFWRSAEHRQSSSYAEHRDINDVMLATRLAPTGYLVLSSRATVSPGADETRSIDSRSPDEAEMPPPRLA